MFAYLAAAGEPSLMKGLRSVERLAAQAKDSKDSKAEKMKEVLNLLKGLQSGMTSAQPSSSKTPAQATSSVDPLLNIMAGKAPVP